MVLPLRDLLSAPARAIAADMAAVASAAVKAASAASRASRADSARVAMVHQARVDMVNLSRVAMDNPARVAMDKLARRLDSAVPARDSVDMVHLKRVAIKTLALTTPLPATLHSTTMTTLVLELIVLAARATPLSYSALATHSVPNLSSMLPSEMNTTSVSTTFNTTLLTSVVSVRNLATASALMTILATVRAHMVIKVASPSTRSATLSAARARISSNPASAPVPASALSPTTTQASASITLPLVVATSSAISSPTTQAMTNKSAVATKLPHSAFLRAIGAVLPPSARATAGEQDQRQRVKTKNLRG